MGYFSRLNIHRLFRCGIKCVTALIVCWMLLVVTHAQHPDGPEKTYRLKPGDKVSIKFLSHPELNETTLVIRPDGWISLQMIGEEKLEALTVAEAKIKLEKDYEEVLLHPEITVTLIEFVAPRFFVSGQVNKPGSYELRAGRTLWQAVALAGGFTPHAHRTMVVHARPSGIISSNSR